MTVHGSQCKNILIILLYRRFTRPGTFPSSTSFDSIGQEISRHNNVLFSVLALYSAFSEVCHDDKLLLIHQFRPGHDNIDLDLRASPTMNSWHCNCNYNKRVLKNGAQWFTIQVGILCPFQSLLAILGGIC